MKNKGITLIALIITIIVLLILAGISIAMLAGDNSILQKATDAKINTENASLKEQVLIAVLGSYETNANLNVYKLKSNLEGVGSTVIGDSFPITATISDKKYTIESNGNVQEVNKNVVTIAELQKNASTYFGYDIINYAETLPEELQNTKWQLFYAGPLDGENEGRIYLISKEYIKNSQLPAVVKNGIKVTPEAKPIAGNTDYKAVFGNTESDGIMSQYSGSSDIAENMKKYNKDYFSKYTSTNPNMKAIAYMLDTATWSPFATSSKNFAEYAMGGPSIELLFTAYNKYKGLSGNYAYVAGNSSEFGYHISIIGNKEDANSDNYTNIIEDDIPSETNPIDNPFSTYNISTNVAQYYYLASPSSKSSDRLMAVYYGGDVAYARYLGSSGGFRPVVLLNSNFLLEKNKDSNNNEVFKIVAK